MVLNEDGRIFCLFDSGTKSRTGICIVYENRRDATTIAEGLASAKKLLLSQAPRRLLPIVRRFTIFRQKFLDILQQIVDELEEEDRMAPWKNLLSLVFSTDTRDLHWSSDSEKIATAWVRQWTIGNDPCIPSLGANVLPPFHKYDPRLVPDIYFRFDESSGHTPIATTSGTTQSTNAPTESLTTPHQRPFFESLTRPHTRNPASVPPHPVQPVAYFSPRVFAMRVHSEDSETEAEMEGIAASTGGTMKQSAKSAIPQVLGYCWTMEDVQRNLQVLQHLQEASEYEREGRFGMTAGDIHQEDGQIPHQKGDSDSNKDTVASSEQAAHASSNPPSNPSFSTTSTTTNITAPVPSLPELLIHALAVQVYPFRYHPPVRSFEWTRLPHPFPFPAPAATPDTALDADTTTPGTGSMLAEEDRFDEATRAHPFLHGSAPGARQDATAAPDTTRYPAFPRFADLLVRRLLVAAGFLPPLAQAHTPLRQACLWSHAQLHTHAKKRTKTQGAGNRIPEALRHVAWLTQLATPDAALDRKLGLGPHGFPVERIPHTVAGGAASAAGAVAATLAAPWSDTGVDADVGVGGSAGATAQGVAVSARHTGRFRSATTPDTTAPYTTVPYTTVPYTTAPPDIASTLRRTTSLLSQLNFPPIVQSLLPQTQPTRYSHTPIPGQEYSSLRIAADSAPAVFTTYLPSASLRSASRTTSRSPSPSPLPSAVSAASVGTPATSLPTTLLHVPPLLPAYTPLTSTGHAPSVSTSSNAYGASGDMANGLLEGADATVTHVYPSPEIPLEEWHTIDRKRELNKIAGDVVQRSLTLSRLIDKGA